VRLLVAISHDVGRSSATTRIRLAASLAFSFVLSASVRRDKRSTCSTSRISPSQASATSRNSSGRASFARIRFLCTRRRPSDRARQRRSGPARGRE
jgi:hypothetical protein